MESLTVSDIVNLMKARNLPIGSQKRKLHLIERLLVSLKTCQPVVPIPGHCEQGR